MKKIVVGLLNEKITMTKRNYIDEIMKAYDKGRIDTLRIIGKSDSEIIELLDLKGVNMI